MLKNTNQPKENMNTFKIEYYHQTTFRNGNANDWDNIMTENVKLDLPVNATRMEICKAWFDLELHSRVTFQSAKLIN